MTGDRPDISAARSILHVDMDAFFAAIAELDDPTLRGKPVLIGGTSPRSVVSTANYEARKYGCGSAMPMSVALRRCPDAVVVSVPGKRIREVSRQVFAIFESITPLVEPLSVDEAFLDVTGSERLLGGAVEIAKQVKGRIRDEVQLTASVGVAPNKFLAKLASDLEKPDGLTVVTPDNTDAILLPLPVTKIWGVGPAFDEKLRKHGLRTVADVRTRSADQLARHFGDAGEHLHRLCHGIDHRRVVPDHGAKSIGQEQTFSHDVADREVLRDVLLKQAEAVAWRLRAKSRYAQAVTLKLRYGDFETITRRQSFSHATHSTQDLWEAAAAIFDRWADEGFRPLRLIGVTAAPLTDSPGRVPGQMELFDDPQGAKHSQLDAAVDAINSKFGKASIHRGKPRA